MEHEPMDGEVIEERGKRKAGRPRLDEIVPHFNEKLKKIYHSTKSVGATAKALGVDTHTVVKYLHENRIPTKSDPTWKNEREPDPLHIMRSRKRRGCFEKYRIRNPGEELPRSYAGIARKTGCSKDSIRAYFRYRTKKTRDFLEHLTDLRQSDLKLQDRETGNWYYLKDLAGYTFRIKEFELTVEIQGVMPNGLHVTFPIEDLSELKQFYRRNTNA